MKEIKSIIDTQSNLDLILESKFNYRDALPIEASEIDRENPGYIIMKYYEGTVKKDEHNKFKESCDGREFLPAKVYDYIFYIQEKGMEEISIQDLDENIINEIAELWLILSEKSEYREYFEKFIFVLYCGKQEKKFKIIALKAYEASEWARNYIEKHIEYRELFLLKRKEDQNYLKRYGIEKLEESESDKTVLEWAGKKSENAYEDWITRKFRGENNG